LSFEGEGLGDLVFCVPILKRQALEHGISFHDELVYLVIHGFLHLLGYDHETSLADEKHMMKLQDDLFERIKKCR
jgi:probable rRNA maturation factor